MSPPRDRYIYYPGTLEVPEAVAANLRGRSFKIAAEVDLHTAEASGVIFAHGAQFGGHALYIKDGQLKYVYNYLGLAAQELVVRHGPADRPVRARGRVHQAVPDSAGHGRHRHPVRRRQGAAS